MEPLSNNPGVCPIIAPDLRVWLSSNFDEFFERCRANGRHMPAPAFDPRCSKLSAEDAFCIFATDNDGRLAHTQAVRAIEHDEGTIGHYFKKNSSLFMPVDPNIDPSMTRIGPSGGWNLAGRRFTYHGEVWIRSDLRKRGLCPALIKFAIAKSIELFNPDHLFTITVPAVMNRKFIEIIGYSGFTSRCIKWKSSDGSTIEEEGIGWIPNRLQETLPSKQEKEFQSVA